MKTLIVASIKGGTGKSLISAMLAQHIAQKRGDVFLVDADVDSPNLADILKVGELEINPDKVEVAHLDGMDFFSVGLYVKRAISMSGESYVQMMIDLLGAAELQINPKKAITIIDAPAGASSLFKYCLKAFADSIVGILAVTTPTSTPDLTRLIEIAKYYGVPIIGVIENMAYFKCECGKEYKFSDGTAEVIAIENGIDFLGQIPLSPEIQQLITAGLPYIPDYIIPILDKVHEKIETLKPVYSKNILDRFVSKVSDAIKRNLTKIITSAIIKINKEVNISKLTSAGFGGKVVEVIIQDKGEQLKNIYLKLDKTRLIALPKANKVDITIIVQLDALLKIKNGELSIEDALYLGDIEIYGQGGTVRALSFLKKFCNAVIKEMGQVEG